MGIYFYHVNECVVRESLTETLKANKLKLDNAVGLIRTVMADSLKEAATIVNRRRKAQPVPAQAVTKRTKRSVK